jgi:tRNA threonylcarbamoyladenosine modification (KEOPS) complex  Pcc1 subunit
MFEAMIKIECENPKVVKHSFEPDAENSEDIKTTIKAGRTFVQIKVRANKIGHLKAILNSYLSLISMLKEAGKIK